MSMKPLPKERLACGCFVLEPYTFREDFNARVAIPIPITSRVTDYYNELLQETPRLSRFLTNDDLLFITNHGRIVSNQDAKKIAIEAGQLDDTGLEDKSKLWPDQIWPV